MGNTPFNFGKFCGDHGIPTAPATHRHYHAGWVSVVCPFCISSGANFHLGYNASRGFFTCWKCKSHSVYKVVQRLSGSKNVHAILEKYGMAPRDRQRMSGPVAAVERVAVCRMPVGCGAMRDNHKDYLISRKYDPDYLAAEYGLLGTGPVGDYKLRVIAPVTKGNRVVSYGGRDITGRQKAYWMFCPDAQEVVHYKSFLYGEDAADNAAVAVVEGLPSVWRLGPGSVATYGTGYTVAQVRRLARYKRRFILFDMDEGGAGQTAARKLAAQLSVFDGQTEIVSDYGAKDPGELSQRDANALMRELGLRR